MDEKKRAMIIHADDWEALFIDGKLITQGHRINGGENITKFLARMCIEHGIDFADFGEG
jgi:hypothetical protein